MASPSRRRSARIPVELSRPEDGPQAKLSGRWSPSQSEATLDHSLRRLGCLMRLASKLYLQICSASPWREQPSRPEEGEKAAPDPTPPTHALEMGSWASVVGHRRPETGLWSDGTKMNHQIAWVRGGALLCEPKISGRSIRLPVDAQRESK